MKFSMYMMKSRRKFLKMAVFSSPIIGGFNITNAFSHPQKAKVENKPVVISTWAHGVAANKAAWKILSNTGTALDAVEKGVRVPEADPEVRTVGYGGYPDREGRVTLDACIMDKDGNCGSVAFLEHIKHPVSVARKVMEDTPHVMLVGEGALQFALKKGFYKENLLTKQSRLDWQNWLQESKYRPIINIENHDTIGMLALDADGNLAGACTTSGAAYKIHGRVGDSPIIGAGLFVDNEVGAATATGLGEAVMKTVGSYLVVELMRQGYLPEDACRMAVERIIAKEKSVENLQVGFIALNKHGQYGGYCIHKGFNYATMDNTGEKLIDGKSKF